MVKHVCEYCGGVGYTVSRVGGMFCVRCQAGMTRIDPKQSALEIAVNALDRIANGEGGTRTDLAEVARSAIQGINRYI